MLCGRVVCILGVVLFIPWRGRFICPFAVAGLGFKYFRINFTLTFGHPSRNPFRTAFNSDDIFGLHNDWCANFTAFTLVLIECVNPAIDWCGARPIQGPGRGRLSTAMGPHVLRFLSSASGVRRMPCGLKLHALLRAVPALGFLGWSTRLRGSEQWGESTGLLTDLYTHVG